MVGQSKTTLLKVILQLTVPSSDFPRGVAGSIVKEAVGVQIGCCVFVAGSDLNPSKVSTDIWMVYSMTGDCSV